MKRFYLATVLSVYLFSAEAQTTTSQRNILMEDNGKTLSFQITANEGGKPIQYARTFDVRRMNTDQKTALKNRVLDSLGLGDVPAPPRPLPAPPPPPGVEAGAELVTFTCTGKMTLSIYGQNRTVTRTFDSSKKDEPAFPFTIHAPAGYV